jgi:hypothetical protein
VVDLLTGGLSTTLYAREIKAKEPIDYFLGLEMAHRKKEAARRVGRPGLSCSTIGPAGTEYGLFGAELETRSFDSVAIPAISELKIDYSILFRIASRIHLNVIGFSFQNPIIGGYAGGPEGAALMRIAACLLMVPVYQAPVTGGEITDFRYNCNCSRESVWASSVSTQALARNSNNIIYGTGSSKKFK